jgi:drug/metabolite transporter superfamily protein YnfA
MRKSSTGSTASFDSGMDGWKTTGMQPGHRVQSPYAAYGGVFIVLSLLWGWQVVRWLALAVMMSV